MAIEVKLPNLGEGIDTGDVLELLVKEGDIVAKDQGIIELETGKATLQVPSSAAGKVAKVHVHPGQTIPPGTLLLTLEGVEGTADRGQGTGDRSEGAGVRSQKGATTERQTAKPAPAASAEKVPSTQSSVPSTERSQRPTSAMAPPS